MKSTATTSRPLPGVREVLFTALLLACTLALPRPAHAEAEMGAANPMATIDATLSDPAVVRGVRAWGVPLDVLRHDIAYLSRAEQRRAAAVLRASWHPERETTVAELKAHYLVMVSLLRESHLYARMFSAGMR